MRVLSLHNSAKFGCFNSINDKIMNNSPRWGRFQPDFRWPLAAKVLIGLKNIRGEMMGRRSSIITQSLVEIERRTSAWVLCFSLFLFVNKAPQITLQVT